MWRSLLKISLRVLWKDRFYAGITLAGLAVAFTAAIFIALWLQFELKWEPFLQDPDSVRGIATDIRLPTAKGFHTLNTPSSLREELDAALGDRITTARYLQETVVMAVGDRRAVENVGTADPNFFRVITVPFLAGDPAHALDEPNSIVLTRALATKYFGSQDPMGRTIELQDGTGRVTGLIDDLPDNSLFKQGAYVAAQSAFSFLSAGKSSTQWWDLNAYTLVRLLPGTTHADLSPVLRQLETAKYPDDETSGVRHHFEIVKIRDAHLLGIVYGQTRDRTSLAALGLIGILTLGIARVNFVNLATARATRRTREIGVRKALGASRATLTLQLLVEPMLLAIVALLIAFVAIELLLPTMSNLLGERLEFSVQREPLLAAGIVLSGLLVGVAAGLYPALLLSRMTPIAALNAAGRSGDGSNFVRQAMVMLQFATSIALIVLTIFLQRQTEHARAVNLTRIAGDPLVVLNDLQRLPDTATRQLILRRLADEPLLRGATGSSLVQGDTKQTLSTRDDIVPGQRTTFSVVRIDQNFFPVHGLKLLAGRNLDDARDTQEDKLDTAVISTSAAKLFGFANPRDAVGRTIGGSGDPTDLPIEIIGVVEDFPLHTVQESMGPTVFVDRPNRFRYITVRVPGGHLREGIDAIERIWNDVAPSYPIQRQFADARVEHMWRSTQNEADVLTSFALVAVLIGSLGLFGLAAYTAQRRTKEIGIRKAMGASTADVVKLLVMQLTRPVIVANLLAWPVALWVVQRWLSAFADRIPIDIWPFLAAGAGTLVLAWTVVIGHALAVGRARPSYALRYE
ncbi:FtsX-like permease family protein [Roseiterribacter gracilis]|uniref:ABC transporter permease n=1 Tax=Roseiterribacter gracilis TaxID=2812848 RepID=A0A8S8XHC6_9PROT|nr:ABC transporter permease [Rhodospirillales bacterium TMPK1]